MRIVTIALIAVPSLLSGCASPNHVIRPFQKYLEANDYTPFKPPNDSLIPLSIISYDKNGAETIVAFAKDCFAGSYTPPPSGAIGLVSYSYKVEKLAQLSAETENLKIGSQPIDVTALAKASGASEVEISFSGPNEQVVSEITAGELIKSWKEECRKVILRPDVIVLHRVAGANEVTYTFKGTNGVAIQLTANILEKAKIDPKAEITVNESGGLKAKNLLYGYRAFQAVPGSGAIGEPGAKLVFLAPAQISQIREAATKK